MRARTYQAVLALGLLSLLALFAFGQQAIGPGAQAFGQTAPLGAGPDVKPTTGQGPDIMDTAQAVDVIVVFREPPRAIAPKGRSPHAADVAMNTERASLVSSVSSLRGKAQPFRFDYRTVLNGVATTLSGAEVERVRHLPYVDYVSEDLPVEALLDDSVPLINADDVWNDPNLGAKGDGVTIAIIDTGIDYTHPDLGGCSEVGPECRVVGGYDFINNDADPMDDHGHGTHVAGIAAGNGGIVGVAPDATLLAYKVLNLGGSGSFSTVIAGVEQAVEDGADVMNLSLGGWGHGNDAMAQAVNNAVDAGVVAAVAAGNSGPGFFSILTPGAAANAITVGATDKTDVMASFSSSGPALYDWIIKPDVVAPGVAINSSVPIGQCVLCDPSGYKELSGTSMAAPHVAGAAALLLELQPDLTPAQVKSALTGTAVRLDGVGSFKQGSGRIDVYGAATTAASLSPSSLNMGIDYGDMPEYTAQKVVTLTNRSAVEQTFTLDVVGLTQAGITVTLDPPGPLTIPQGGSEPVTVTVTVDDSQVPFLAEPPYAYEGWLRVVGASQSEVRAPIAFIKGRVLEISYDRQPVWVWIHNQHDWDTNVVGASLIRVPAPAGTYDIVTGCSHQEPITGETVYSYIWREDVVHDVVTRLDISCDEATHVLHVDFPFLALTENGGWQLMLEYEPSGKVPRPPTQEGWGYEPHSWVGDPSNSATIAVSDVSPDYTVEWSVRLRSDAENQYIANYGWRDGIYADELHDLQPEDFTVGRYDYLPLEEQGVDALSILAYDCQGGPWWSCAGEPLASPLPLDTVDQVHYLPAPYQEFALGYVRRSVVDHDTGASLARTPWGRIEADGSFYQWGGGQKLFVSADGTMPVGVSPMSWAAVFNNSATTVSLTTLIPGEYWSSQAGDARLNLSPPGLPLHWALDCPEDWDWEDWNQCADDGDYTGPVFVEQAAHTFHLTSGSYTLADTSGTVRVEAEFSPVGAPPWYLPKNANPPTITGFRVEQDGVPTDEVWVGTAENQLVVSAVDDTCSAPPSVSMSIDLGSGWSDLVEEYDPITQTYTADLGTFGLSEADTLASVRVIATDCHSNSVSMDVLPAFRVVYRDTDGDGCGDRQETAAQWRT
jgi:subtilisin family serine protease